MLAEQSVEDIICNPIYVGIGPYPALITDEQWSEAGTIAIKQYGLERYMANVLDCVEMAFGEPFPEREQWVKAAEKQVKSDGARDFLHDLLKHLRKHYKGWRIRSPIRQD